MKKLSITPILPQRQRIEENFLDLFQSQLRPDDTHRHAPKTQRKTDKAGQIPIEDKFLFPQEYKRQ